MLNRENMRCVFFSLFINWIFKVRDLFNGTKFVKIDSLAKYNDTSKTKKNSAHFFESDF